MRRVLAAVAALAAVGALALWVLRSNPAEAPPVVALDHARAKPQGDAFVIAFGALPEHLNPWTTADAVARRWVLRYTHDALLEFDARTGAPSPALAERVEPLGDGRSWTLQLRDGVRFADGAPLGIEDVLFTWELARADHGLPGSVWTDLRLLESVEALDDRRLRLVLAEQHFAGLGLAATSYQVVQKRWFIAAVAAVAARRDEPAPRDIADPAFGRLLREVELPGPGTGPYALAVDPATGRPRWPPADSLLLVQNPHSWRRSAYPEDWNLAALTLVRIVDPAARRPRLRGGTIDWAEDDDPAATLAADPELAAQYRPCVYATRTQGPVFVVWNHDRQPLGDPRVRTALTMLFDRARIVELIGARARPAVSWFAPGSARAGELPPPPFDPAGARQLLEQAGAIAGGASLALSILVAGGPDHERIVDLAIPAFRKAGVELRKQIVTPQVLNERIAGARDFDAFIYAWNPDPFNDPTEVFHSALAQHNWMHYRSAELDRALEAARVELDEDKRVALYHEFNRIVARDQPITLLYHRNSCGLLHRRFQGVEIGEMGLIPRHWWVAPADQRYRFAAPAPGASAR